eukprot:jgi/Tetstr1/453833/TSEL_003997.t1
MDGNTDEPGAGQEDQHPVEAAADTPAAGPIAGAGAVQADAAPRSKTHWLLGEAVTVVKAVLAADKTEPKATQSSRAAHREMNSCRKKARRDEERKQAAKDVVEQHSQSISKQAAATADVLDRNNAIWEIELMLKHGDEQQKAKALELMAKNMEEAMPTPSRSTMTEALSSGSER